MGKCLIIKGADFSAVAADQVNIQDPKVVITVVASPAGGGTTAGTGSYTPGQTITISATPSAGYDFVQWNDGNTNATRNIVVGNSAVTYTAEFQEQVEIINTVDGAYLNGSGNVTGEGQTAYALYQILFYKSNVPSIRIYKKTAGVESSSVIVYAVYSGIDANNRGTGMVSKKTASSSSEEINDIVDTSVNKYIGVAWYKRQPSSYPVVTKNETE